MSYPILVKDFATQAHATTIVCESCHAELVIHADNLLNEGLYNCPVDCGGSAIHKYEIADECPNCKKLGYWSEALDHCCSRVCQLQAEYAATLREEVAPPQPST